MKEFLRKLRRDILRIRKNPKLVFDYTQGNVRYFLYRNLPFLLTKDFKEQIKYRLENANKECIKQGVCTHCGCKTPNLFFSDKSCEGGCYPPIMNSYVWYVFKQTKENK